MDAAPPVAPPQVSDGPLHTAAAALPHGDRKGRRAHYLRAAADSLARARYILRDVLTGPNVPEVPIKEPVTLGDSPTPDATPTDVPVSVHNLPGQIRPPPPPCLPPPYLALLVTGMQDLCLLLQ